MTNPLIKLVKTLLIALPLIGILNKTFADVPVGTVVRQTGKVSVIDAKGNIQVLAVGGSVKEGDAVATEKASSVQLQMKDGALIALTAESVLKISLYHSHEANGEKDGIKLTLQKGRMRTITGDTQKDTYQLTTPTATIGINGTVYDVMVSPDSAVTTLILREGEVVAEPVCEGGATAPKQVVNVPGTSVQLKKPCTCTKPSPATEAVADLDAALPMATAAGGAAGGGPAPGSGSGAPGTGSGKVSP